MLFSVPLFKVARTFATVLGVYLLSNEMLPLFVGTRAKTMRIISSYDSWYWSIASEVMEENSY